MLSKALITGVGLPFLNRYDRMTAMTISTDRFIEKEEPATSRQNDVQIQTSRREPESPFKVSVELHGEAWNDQDCVL